MIYTSEVYKKALYDLANDLPDKSLSFMITGATGLIGSCMIDLLMLANQEMNRDYHVYALGRNRDKLSKRFSYVNNPNTITYIVQDITDPIDESIEVDYVVHAASNADPVSYARHPAETLLTNIYGAKNVYDYCKTHNNARVLLTSTFEVYGHNHATDCYAEDTEGVITLNSIRSGYPESKRCAEILLRSYVTEYGIDGVIARLCSIYGPTMQSDDSKAHAQFLRNALSGENIVLKSKGSQIRTYCYVMDAVSALLTILFNGKTGEAYNVSNENSIASIAEVAKKIADICHTKVRFELPDELESKGFSRPQNCVLANERLRNLGWRGRYDLNQGLSETLSILKEIYSF